MSKRRLLEIEAYLAELDPEELCMLRASVDDMLLVYAKDDDEVKELLAQQQGCADIVASELTDHDRHAAMMAEPMTASGGGRPRKLN
jgi:hypothetical protein